MHFLTIFFIGYLNSSILFSDCYFLLDLHKRFLEIIEQEKSDIDIFSFIETSFTLMSFLFLKIVAYQSAGKSIFLTQNKAKNETIKNGYFFFWKKREILR